ncbi:MAG: hypothetical protein PHE49_08830 [bacterium]|nr:hypothetical protein [bacterium]
MKNSIKLLAVVVTGVLIMGCEGPKVKQAVDALKPQVDELQNQVAAMQTPLGQLTEIGKKVEGKVEKTQIDSLILQIDGLKGNLVSLLAIEEQVTVMKDSLAVLDKKASGEAKTAITELNGKLDAVVASLGEVKMACGVADGLKGKLETMKAPVKVEKKASKPIKAKVK